jgi:BirA family biotin operon repressor/biotin-[acetyl-CoA-carboxylase] ligase
VNLIWEHLKTIDSTQTFAHKYIRENPIAKPVLITSDIQTNGYGTKNSQWESPNGNLYATLCFKPKYLNLSEISIISAKIMQIAIKEIAKIDVEIKEPNDLMYKNKKCGGILCTWETDASENEILCIGVGVNCKQAPQTSQATTIIPCDSKKLAICWANKLTLINN